MEPPKIPVFGGFCSLENIMSSLSKVIIVIAVACTIIGCAPPIGNIGGGGAGSNLDSLRALPKRTVYDIPDKFQRDDLTVVASYRSILRIIPINEVDIYVIEDVKDPIEDIKDPDKRRLVNPDPNFPFVIQKKGLKIILVEYNNLSDMYYIDVTNPYGLGGNDDNNGEPGIEVTWDH